MHNVESTHRMQNLRTWRIAPIAVLSAFAPTLSAQARRGVARAKGYDCDYRALRVADLFAAQGVWLVSSITLAARVHTLDGRLLPSAPMATEFAELVDAAIVSDR